METGTIYFIFAGYEFEYHLDGTVWTYLSSVGSNTNIRYVPVGLNGWFTIPHTDIFVQVIYKNAQIELFYAREYEEQIREMEEARDYLTSEQGQWCGAFINYFLENSQLSE